MNEDYTLLVKNLARLTINFFRRFSVTTSWVYNWFSCSAFRQLHFQRHWCLRQVECNRPFVGCFSVVIRIVFAAKTLFYIKNLLINSLFSFIFLYFCRAFAINAFVNNNFDMKIVELNYSNGVVGGPYAEDLCHSVNTLINYITGNCY